MMPIEHTLARLLIKKTLTLSIAESCTGGLVSHRLTNIPGSSAFLWLSITAYDNLAKMTLLHVSPSTISLHGAVSQATALAMAKGVRGILKTSTSLSITGIAGPTGGDSIKPVGTVFIAALFKNKMSCHQYYFKGSRLRIKTQAADAALKQLISLVK